MKNQKFKIKDAGYLWHRIKAHDMALKALNDQLKRFDRENEAIHLPEESRPLSGDPKPYYKFNIWLSARYWINQLMP